MKFVELKARIGDRVRRTVTTKFDSGALNIIIDEFVIDDIRRSALGAAPEVRPRGRDSFLRTVPVGAEKGWTQAECDWEMIERRRRTFPPGTVINFKSSGDAKYNMNGHFVHVAGGWRRYIDKGGYLYDCWMAPWSYDAIVRWADTFGVKLLVDEAIIPKEEGEDEDG